MIIYNSRLAKLLKVNGITLWPFIFISHSKKNCPDWLLRHEQIHIEQQLKWWIIPFYIVYLWDYARGIYTGLKHDAAYRAVRFEIEAYKEYHTKRRCNG